MKRAALPVCISTLDTFPGDQLNAARDKSNDLAESLRAIEPPMAVNIHYVSL